MEDIKSLHIFEESDEKIKAKMAMRVPGYLPQEVYESGQYIVGEDVVLFDKRKEEKKTIIMHVESLKE
jgi:hypothetical protein